MKKTNQRKPITALELRCSAGCAPERRGSALLIVIGTLALVAVFAAVYVAIGRTDRRAANALRARIDQKVTSEQIADYLAGVVGDDRLDAQVVYDTSGNPFGLREVIDLPYTDWSRRSEAASGNNGEEALLFLPTGRPYRQEGLNETNDFRVASDPWLASTLPTYLGNPGDPSNTFGVDERQFSSYEDFDQNYPNSKNYLEYRDWLQISNFAPDGRPVNLFNLRPNASPVAGSTVAQNEVGGFTSEPGFGTSPRADGRQIRRMSNYLSIFKLEEGVDPTVALIQASDPNQDGIWVPGHNEQLMLSGLSGLDLYNTPAVWTMYQRYMFIPMNQPFVTKDRTGRETSWANPDYPPYQYADADGDGFADSRWFELRSARDSSNGSGSEREDIESLFEQGDYRYFIAARAVDLSSMVNVNTATDQLAPPSIEYPMGLTPAEVDLRRLLTMQDQAGDYTSAKAPVSGVSLSMQAAPRPYTTSEVLANPTSWAMPSNNLHFQRDVQDYNFYQLTARNSNFDLRTLDTDAPSLLIGRYAYDALRRGILFGGSLSDRYQGYNLQAGDSPTSPSRSDLVQYQIDPSDTSGSIPPAPIDAEGRYEQYMQVGRLDPINSALEWSTDNTVNQGGGLYGIDDLAEILTYHGLNDPDFTSRLERVVSGRFISPTDDELQARRMSPMMSNRSLSLDRYSHSRILDHNDLRWAPTIENPSVPSRIGEISRNSLALMTLTPRKKMTTVSGHVPLSPDDQVADASLPEAIDADTVLNSLSTIMSSPARLFELYSNALSAADMSRSGTDTISDLTNGDWVLDPTMFDQFNFSTLFYGHRGPEQMLRIAAHLAVNMADIADGSSDTDVTVATLLLDQNERNSTFGNTANFEDPEADQLYRLYPGMVEGALFDIDPNGSNNTLPNSLPDSRKIVNIYGMEATPVITEVSTMYIYHDTAGPRSGELDVSGDFFGGLGDIDWDPTSEPSTSGGMLDFTGASDPVPVTINGDRNHTVNPDYLGQVVAFQLHNPHAVPISLGGNGLGTNDPLTRQRNFQDQSTIDVNSNYQFDYYIEFAGRFYKLGKYIDWYPTAENGENYYSIDDPLSVPAYGSVPNPQDSYPDTPGGVGGRMDPGDMRSDGSGSMQAEFSDFIMRNVVLQPGETRVFYVLAEKRFDDLNSNLDQKWTTTFSYYDGAFQGFQTGIPNSFTNAATSDLDNDGLLDGRDGRGWTGPAEEWFSSRMTVRTGREPIMMMEFDPQNGYLLNEELPAGAVSDPTSIAVSPSPLFNARNDAQSVRLWKKVTTTGEETDEQDNTLGNIQPTYRNLLANDLLVDRMELPETLTRELNGGMNQPLVGTVSYREDIVNPSNGVRFRNDNMGITVVDWKTIRRGDSETALDVDKPRPGEIAPWMLGAPTGGNAQLGLQTHIPLGMLDSSSNLDGLYVVEDNNRMLDEPPVAPYFETYITFRSFFDSAISPGNEPIQTLVLEPHYKSDPTDAENPGPSVVEDDSGNNTIGKFAAFTIPLSGTGLDESNAVLFTGGISDISARPRLADLLLPWGIGASFSPDVTSHSSDGVYNEEEWTTMPELLAQVMGFEQNYDQTNDHGSVWNDSWNTTELVGLFEDGRLSLDRYIPFVNTNAGSEDPPVFDILDVTGTQDILRGAGVPLAYGVIDRARAIDRTSRVTDPLNSGSMETELSLTRPIFGTININTAPVEVLRLLPGLSPSRSSYLEGLTGGALIKEWWGARSEFDETYTFDNEFVPSSANDLLGQPDVPAAIVAYRDRVFSSPMTSSRTETVGANVLASGPAWISPTRAEYDLRLTQNMMGEVPLTGNPGNFSPMDRGYMTGIEGLRSTPGFASLGELMAVRIDSEFRNSDSGRWINLRHLSIDQLGHDEVAQGIANETTILPQIYEADNVGATVDDYAEKLALADGVLNMLSVRSDYYALWFVIQGYRESDVANLRPEDPLIPSLQKRYIMVVDRSNVIEPGDKPKIVLLKEVPL